MPEWGARPRPTRPTRTSRASSMADIRMAALCRGVQRAHPPTVLRVQLREIPSELTCQFLFVDHLFIIII